VMAPGAETEEAKAAAAAAAAEAFFENPEAAEQHLADKTSDEAPLDTAQ
jgi:hypothetical protein